MCVCLRVTEDTRTCVCVHTGETEQAGRSTAAVPQPLQGPRLPVRRLCVPRPPPHGDTCTSQSWLPEAGGGWHMKTLRLSLFSVSL